MRYPPEELRQPSAQILRFSAVIVLIVSLYRRLFAFNPRPSSSISHAPNLILKQKPSYSFPCPPTFYAAAHISFCLSNDSKKCVVRTSMRLTECWRPFRRSSGRGEEGDRIGGEEEVSVDVGSGTLDFLHL